MEVLYSDLFMRDLEMYRKC